MEPYVIGVFALMIAALVFFMTRIPYLHIRIMEHEFVIETYAVAVLIGPILLLAIGLLPPSGIYESLRGSGDSSPLGILSLFLSMVFISTYLDRVGFMEYCAKTALKSAKRSGRRLFFYLYGLVAILTIFTSNDILILTMTPFVYYFAKHARVDPLPYLLAEFFAANSWSMMLQVGNPTNILITATHGIRFFEYLTWMFFPSLIGGLANAAIIYLIFRKRIDVKVEAEEGIDPEEAIKDGIGMRIGLFILAASLISLSVSPYLGIDMWVVSMSYAAILLVMILFRARRHKAALKDVFVKMPWSIIPFVLSFFVMVHAMETHGILDSAAEALGRWASEEGTVISYGIASTLSANILNNIPMSAAFASMMSGLFGERLLAAALSTAAGSNLGANITPIGALAGIMWMNILRHKRYRITYWKFIYYGSLTTAVTLFATLAALALEFAIF